ncbi:putative triacylglycerol lipase [Mycolicibacterium chitae]|nr:prolyl oligopeptidase family serine peptidase [Mycolicibacterium chitae]BBZ02021.1 putative triacylglycerol lipase [Mycolicibacterium chitae]
MASTYQRPQLPATPVAFALLGILTLLITLAHVTSPAQAAAEDCPPNIGYQPECQYRPFYTPPSPLPDGTPGDLVRTEPSRIALDPAGHGNYKADGTRLMYQSRNLDDDVVAVTGTYFEPHNPWTGAGPRPLLALAPFPTGLGDQCAVSRVISEGGFHYGGYLDYLFLWEQGFFTTMLDRGFALVVTDYQGTGTYGPPTSGIRVPTANAVIDSARAAKRLPDTSLTSDSPVAFWGWGPGGFAAGAAAELAPSYAPELDVVGAWIGAPTADYSLLPDYADGSLFIGVLGYTLNSFIAAFPEAEEGIRGVLTPRGIDMLEKTRYNCINEVMTKFMFRHVQPYFDQNYRQILDSEPLKSALAAQKLGSLKPAAPVQISVNRYDPLFPYIGAQQLAQDWCARDADVELWTNEQPPFLNKTGFNSLVPYFVDGERGMQWITDRFNALPTTSNCHQL